MAEHIPEDVLKKIFQRLPIKSLIRFSSLSKRWRFIILRDRQFATSQYQIASGNNKSVCLHIGFKSDSFQSLNLQTTTSALRNLRYPFRQPHVYLLSSCRGLVFASFKAWGLQAYMWNPSTGFFKKLPHPDADVMSSNITGFGYISATDDYKILMGSSKKFCISARYGEVQKAKIWIFSSKSNSWKRIQDCQSPVCPKTTEGSLLNEAFHWLETSCVVAFDLADDKFRKVPLPVDFAADYFRRLGDFGGCLCVFGLADTTAGSLDLWVMREYDVGNSWTKLFNIKYTNQPERIYYVNPIFVMETSTFLVINSDSLTGVKLVRSYHNEDKIEDIHYNEDIFSMIGYEESLLWLE
ncbi:F-box protein CPR1-like [Rosa rugosa]|uniref:F-box protein CPR1-like n=1 Tax=Rosa rugosa TaxID=74645 RepID=UPI002B403D93|nr:F-box protein CPR1-like [Rosa rugosa]